ncbi:MAG: hypothetical protein PHU49_06495 [Syntrophorhabdaceae bacterium]|nr:hypothetical protein [Syntrophorhabdaceae bacterium]
MGGTKLTSGITVRQYRDFKDSQDREGIANLIDARFMERYIDPFKNNPSKHGFAMMAVCCLMMEALFCFRRGRKKTGEKGSDVFEKFFVSSAHLKEFVGLGGQFYSNVRCGILHQGETYGGWKILRKGSMLSRTDKTINATAFITALEKELHKYTTELKSAPIRSELWRNAIRKLDHVCENCIV